MIIRDYLTRFGYRLKYQPETPLSAQELLKGNNPNPMIYTHYHNSNLIWRTVSRRVDEVIPSDHPRRVASWVIQWYDLIHET